MSNYGLLVLSNLKKIQNSFEIIKKHVQNLYIYLNVTESPNTSNPSLWSKTVSKIYQDSIPFNSELNIRVLLTHLKVKQHQQQQLQENSTKHFEYLFLDRKIPNLCKTFKKQYSIQKSTIILYDNNNSDVENDANQNEQETENSSSSSSTGNKTEEIYDTVVLGGTFDRIHIGHKILLTEGVLRARKRLVVGVTDENMITSKTLYELILPVEERIKDVRTFLNEIDSTLQYDVVAIQDPFGPTKSDPNMDMIIVSAETLRGGEKINELRLKNNLNTLKIHCISIIECEKSSNQNYKEAKISSSNQRMDLLGTRINPKQPRPNLPEKPYIIGLGGGICSGKSKMAERLQNFGAFVIDCDKLAHEIYEPGKECYRKIIEVFGNEIINKNDKKIDRKKLGNLVFGNTALLEKLNEIVWPELLVETKKRIYESYAKKPFNVAVIEAAILLKAGWDKECHEVWSMIVSSNEAIKRLKERNNLSEEEARKRLDVQISNKEFVKKSNVVFSSEWCHEFTQEQAERSWKMLMTELRQN